MNKKVLLTTFFFILFCLLKTVFSQASPTLTPPSPTTSNSQYFTVNYEIGRQSVWNKSVPLNVYITPKNDYTRVEIIFDHGTMTDVKYKGKPYFPVKAGQTYQVQGKIHPKEKGLHHITINAIAWEHNTNYTSSASAVVNIDENLEIIPQTQEYKILNVLKYVFLVTAIIGVIGMSYFIGKKNSVKIKKWLEPEF